jgi:sulfite exporter TauE/SafE
MFASQTKLRPLAVVLFRVVAYGVLPCPVLYFGLFSSALTPKYYSRS